MNKAKLNLVIGLIDKASGPLRKILDAQEAARVMSKAEQSVPRQCEKCRKAYIPRAAQQRFCGSNCANSALGAKFKNGAVIACDDCGGPNYLSLSQYRQKVEHPNWHKRCPECVMDARRCTPARPMEIVWTYNVDA